MDAEDEEWMASLELALPGAEPVAPRGIPVGSIHYTWNKPEDPMEGDVWFSKLTNVTRIFHNGGWELIRATDTGIMPHTYYPGRSSG